MSEFLQLNLLNYNTVEHDNQKFTRTQDICICCLQRNTKFINLSTCIHTTFLDFCYKFKIDYQKSVMCYKCHHFLMKIEQFQHLVVQSKSILSEQIKPIASNKTFLNLQFTGTELNSIDAECSMKNECYQPASTNSAQDQYTKFSTEVKVEHNSSDFEIDVPLSEIKKEIKRVKKKRKKVKIKKVISKKRSSVHDKYEGKIAIVTLSAEEMYAERERDAKKDSYLKLPYKCESCITGFDHELTLQDHMQKRHGDKTGGYECNVCKSVLSTETSYKEHTKRHTRRYECQECGKRNNNVYSVIKHYNQVHGTIDTEFTCQDCGFTTGSHRSYRYHRDKHKQKQQCTLCASTFVNNAGLRVHMFTVHKQSSRVYSCEECNKVYNAKSGLMAHMASAHSISRGAYCATCRTHYRSDHNLVHHLRTHSAHVTDTDKKFICDECGAKFLTKSSLQEHIDYVHLKNKKHECSKCNKVFINGSALKKHENFVHKKIRPPRNKICDHCGRGFTTLTILQSHVRTHTGERPLRCSHCPATFAHSAALYTHNKLLHNAGRSHK